MSAGRYDIVIEKGSYFSKPLTWQSGTDPVDLTGWTARMQIRENYTISTVILELSTSNGRITLGGITGVITLIIPAALSSPITAREGVYDLELIDPSSEPHRFLEGRVKFKPEVTR